MVSPPATSETDREGDIVTPTAKRPLVADPRPLFGFLTRLPVGRGASFEAFVAAFPLVPVVGWFTGLVAGLAALLLVGFAPPYVLAALVLSVAVGLTGLNQADGLLDLGDGLMVHGDSTRRLQVMHDPHAGVGAFGLVFFAYLLAFAALADLATYSVGDGDVAFQAHTLPAAVLLAEVLSRLPFLVLSWRGRASHPGLGEQALTGFGTRHLAVGVLVTAPALLTGLVLGWAAVLAAAASMLLVALILRRTAYGLLGGVGGDVMGASQELSRTACLVAVALMAPLGS